MLLEGGHNTQMVDTLSAVEVEVDMFLFSEQISACGVHA